MSDKPIDPASIQWIRDEIEKNSEQAILALEGYFEHSDSSFLSTAKAALHQIYGTLQIVELYPPSTLAQELEMTLDYLLTHDEALSDEYLSKIIQCITLIVRYIDGVLRNDVALTAQELLPPLNILREIRHESAIEPIVEQRQYFENQDVSTGDNRKSVQALSVKLLKLFQFSYLKFAEGEDQKTNLSYMTQSIERFSRLFPQKNLKPLWGVIINACQSLLLEKQYKKSLFINEFFGKLTHLLKIFASSKAQEVDSLILTELFLQGLQILNSLKILNEAGKMLLDHHRDKLPKAPLNVLDTKVLNNSTLSALGDALIEEIGYIKDALDIFSRSKEMSQADLQNLLLKLKLLSDSMIMAQQLEIPRESLNQQILRLDKMITTSAVPSEDWLIDLATSLLFVESSANSIKQKTKQNINSSKNAEDLLRDAKKALLREILVDLSQVKSLFVECVSAAWDLDSLKQIRHLLHQTEFRLLYLDEDKAMSLLEQINNYIFFDLINRTEAPPWRDIEEFADIIAAVDQYLYLKIETKTQTSKLLDDAEKRLSKLFVLTDEQKASQVDHDIVESQVESTPNRSSEQSESITVMPVENSNNIESDVDSDEDADQEIREIFREELDEIYEELKPLVQTLSQNLSDYNVLGSIRRLIHTVKGSGRMARLPLVSEPAWALESLLNELLDKNQQPDLQLIHHISDFTEQMKVLAQDSQPATKAVSERLYKCFDQYLDASSEEVSADNTEVEEPIDQEVIQDPSEDNVSAETFNEMQCQEIKSHLLVIQHYYKSNLDFISKAPQDESLLRALHTLKAIFRGSEHSELSESFIHFEEHIREIMKLGLHQVTDFFEGLAACCTLVQKILEKESNLEPSIIGLKRINAHLKSLLDQAPTSQTPYEEWINDSGAIFDLLIQNNWVTGSDEIFAVNQKSLEHASSQALKLGLTELAELLYCYIQYIQRYHLLPESAQEEFSADLGLLNDHLLQIGDQIALGHSNVRPEQFLEESFDLLTRLKAFEIAEPQTLQNLQTLEGARAEVTQDENESYAELESDEDDIEDTLEFFKEEVNDILDSIDFHIKRMNLGESSLTKLKELQRDYHTIKGSAQFMQEQFLYALAKEADLICERFYDSHQLLTSHGVSILVLTQNLMRDRLSKLPNIEPLSDLEQQVINDLKNTQPAPFIHDEENLEENINEDDQELASVPEAQEVKHQSALPDKQRINQEITQYIASQDQEIIEIFIEEALELVKELDHICNMLQGEQEEPLQELWNKTLRIVHTLKGGSKLAGITLIGDSAQQLEKKVEHTAKEDLLQLSQELKCFSNDVKSVVTQINATFNAESDELQDDQFTTEETAPVFVEDDAAQAESEAEVLADSDVESQNLESDSELPEQHLAKEVISLQDAEVETVVPHESTSEHNPKALSPTVGDTEIDSLDDYDQEILEIFFEESKELVEELEKCVGSIVDASIDDSRMDQLKRILHTIKGSARLAGFAAFGNQAHLFESHLEVLTTPTQPDETEKVIALHDELFHSLQEILEAIKRHISKPEPVKPEQLNSESAIQPEAVQQFKKNRDAQKQAKRRKNTEVVRIGAELLERLENLAGETVIARSSVEQELIGFGRIIDEFGITLNRVRDQIRFFESETENRMLSNSYVKQLQSQSTQDDEQEFDTLEMDQFSSLHHLARSLSEAASDLIDMRDSMIDKMRATEGLVLQQSRVQTELHEGLMLSRMVPFSRLAPRLTRMVRQVAEELGKKAELTIINAEGQMDRSVLERMIPPLEHMLRNALDHGIELPEIREKNGKPAIGKIVLHLFREGNEIVLRLSDDGAGIDVEKVKAKAIQNNLLSPNSTLSEKEILQFIFKPGFTTASKVTQISGRGVGMDVVFSEIKQLNGTLKLHAAPNVGTQFTIRLPFTVSMSRALLVKVGDESYAIPLTYIEGVVRVSPYELRAIYESERQTFSYAGKEYEVNYLGEYLYSKNADLNVIDSVPLLLARSTERSVAVQVDTLIGSEEIIIKNPGQQLNQVIGLSGATIMGDGSVVLILDLNALIRDDIANAHKVKQPDQEQIQNKIESSNPLIMVVDDSVTVRKVTSRLLERHGMDVITAKDGIDAVTQLRDSQPDLILLDIEMPRMDGFEVASHIRHDPRLIDTPIIMISSRTGEKHRQRASALGVNAFLGKPYQEVELLEHIAKMLKEKSGSIR